MLNINEMYIIGDQNVSWIYVEIEYMHEVYTNRMFYTVQIITI